MSGVVLENVTKVFGKVTAVDNVNLKGNPGEFLALLGPSGCGKTTTLRLIAGLEDPTKGNIYIGDTLVNELPPKDRNVAMVFQSYALYPHMTVFDNIAFPLKIRKVPKDEILKKVEEVAALLGITELLDRKPKEISGGQRQRVALGRAIVRSPTVFLMDEPLSNLDAKLRVQMRVELKKLQKQLGVTTIYVTHDQIEAMTMSDRVALMDKGKIKQIDTPEMLYHKPNNIWVAGFIGSPPMNFIVCFLEAKENEISLIHESFKLPLPDALSKAIKEEAKNQEVVLGFRPEDSLITLKRGNDAIKAKVYALEPMGDALIVDLLIGESLVKVKAKADLKLEIESEVYLKILLDKIHIFDKKSQQAIL
jgi:multiple sugar transport system ATP-binding protein